MSEFPHSIYMLYHQSTIMPFSHIFISRNLSSIVSISAIQIYKSNDSGSRDQPISLIY